MLKFIKFIWAIFKKRKDHTSFLERSDGQGRRFALMKRPFGRIILSERKEPLSVDKRNYSAYRMYEFLEEDNLEKFNDELETYIAILSLWHEDNQRKIQEKKKERKESSLMRDEGKQYGEPISVRAEIDIQDESGSEPDL